MITETYVMVRGWAVSWKKHKACISASMADSPPHETRPQLYVCPTVGVCVCEKSLQ